MGEELSGGAVEVGYAGAVGQDVVGGAVDAGSSGEVKEGAVGAGEVASVHLDVEPVAGLAVEDCVVGRTGAVDVDDEA